MTGYWETRGEVDRCSVTHVVLSPDYPVDRTVFVVTPAGLAVSRDDGHSWETPARGRLGPFIRDLVCSPTFVADGIVRATTPAGQFESSDRGRTWACVGPIASPDSLLLDDEEDDAPWSESTLSRPVLSYAVSPTGDTVWAGLVDGGCARSRDRGATWESIPIPAGAVVVDLKASADRLIARTVEGLVAQSLDGGVAWQSGPVPEELCVHDLVAPADGATPLFATTKGLVDPGNPTPLLDEEITSLAIRENNPRLVAAATGRSVFLSHDDARTWESLAPPLDDAEAIVALTIGTPADQTRPDLLAVGTLDADHRGAVWLRSGALPWRRVIAHPEPAPAVCLATSPPNGKIMAAIGDRFYRPSRAGQLLLAPEPIDESRDLSILRLIAAQADDTTPVLAALSTVGIYVSTDDGLTWDSTPPLPGPPPTAIAFQRLPDRFDLLAAQLGGRILALCLSPP